MTGHKDPLVGVHASAAGGVFNALKQGHELGCTTIQLFSANQKTWSPKPLSQDVIDKWFEVRDETGLKEIMVHDSYLINLGSPKEDGLKKSRAAFAEEINRCTALDIAYLNFHPGAALDGTREECMDRIAESLIQTAPLLEGSNLCIVLETTAGQGTAVGYLFEELGYIIGKVAGQVPVGVCIDTCHIFAAGYDIRTRAGWDETLALFEQHIGLDYLKGFHVNDSLKPYASRRDRHANLGEGEIGIECFKVMMTHPKIRHLPKYLETPNGETMWREEVKLLKKFAAAKG